MSAYAELSSTVTGLDQLIDRVVDCGRSIDRPGTEDLAADLDEVERALTSARRRLERAVQELGRRG